MRVDAVLPHAHTEAWEEKEESKAEPKLKAELPLPSLSIVLCSRAGDAAGSGCPRAGRSREPMNLAH